MSKISHFIDRIENFSSLSQKEQVKLVSFFIVIESKNEYFTTSIIKDEFIKSHLHIPSNISNELLKLKKEKILIQTKNWYSFNRIAKSKISEEQLWINHIKETNNILQGLINLVKNDNQKKFLEEAIKCFDIKAFRAAIIMTWLLTLDILYDYVLISDNLEKFNSAVLVQGKYKKNQFLDKENFSVIKESDFIELLKTSKLITNDIRKLLDEKLWIRNSCAHPNSILIEDYKAINFIQDIVKNVINKYQK